MDGENTQPGQMPQAQNQNIGAPPPPEVNLRTMASDIRSIQSGEAMPVPESVLPPEDDKEAVFRPETQASGSGGLEEEEPPKKSKFLLWTVLAVVIVAIGVGGYFVYPLLFPTASPEAVLPPPEQSPAPSAEPVPPAPLTHQSFFLNLPTASGAVNIGAVSASSISASLDALAKNSKLSASSVQEVRISDEQGNQIPFSSYAVALLPGFSSVNPGKWFEDDFTEFLYYNDKGVWPGFIAKIKSAVNLEELEPQLAFIQAEDLSKMYLSSPGNFGSFKEGNLNGKKTHYAIGSAQGASMNYLISGPYFIVSTSYDGLQHIATLLNF